MSERKQPQVPQLNLGGFGKGNPSGQKGVMQKMDPRKMQHYEQMQDEEGSDYDEESCDSGDDDIGLMQQKSQGQP